MSLILKGIDLPKEGEDITLEINHKGEIRAYSTELKEINTDTQVIQIDDDIITKIEPIIEYEECKKKGIWKERK